MADQPREAAVGLAALTITQSLLAVLLDRGILSREDLEELLAEAAATDADDGELAGEAGELVHDLMEALVPRTH